jgi:diguanylate cyclase (GGDEF)-like protein
LLDATGALVRIGDDSILLGQTPPAPVAASIVRQLRQLHGEDIVGISDAGRPGGVAPEAPATASGILHMPILNNPQDAVVWFRPERLRTVTWGGDPTQQLAHRAGDGALSPRTSFAKWTEQISGQSKPWTAIDLQTAHEMRRTITAALLRQAELRLAQLSAYDPLTSLANRRTLKARIEACRASGEHPISSMLFFDLDRFKMINDSLGHGAGDQVLIQIATRMCLFIPADAMAVRLGGDEFVVFWPGADRGMAEALAARLMHELSAPLLLQDQQHYVTVSIGIACSDPAGLDQLLREADEAMYAAKRQGGGQVVFFQPSHHTRVLTANQIEQDLFRAVENNALEVHYQPIVVCPGRTISGFEALIRWRHAVRGWISPAEFIPRAEETGLIVRIGSWVFANAVRQLAAWHRIDPTLTMSINVSARQLTDGAFSTYVASVLEAEHVQADRIYIEVTESALMHDGAVRELHRVRAMGCKVSVDDFGTGYSSLAYLQSLPVDVVKIDRSFVARLGPSTKASRFFAAILALAHTLDLHSVAEGCETEEQWSIVQEAGCDFVQGWLIARAMEPGQISAMLLKEAGKEDLLF